jgi:copper chaperone
MNQSTSPVTATYTVTGMTCDHCATSVREEIGALSGVRQVDVDVPSGRVTVTSDSELPTEAVRSAVGEAGYQLVTA